MRPPFRYDAIVVGSGPAGSTAAMTLAAAGRAVALLERERFPRYKTCGGGVVARALAALPCPPPGGSDIPLLPVYRVTVHGGAGDGIVVDRDEPPLTMVMRADFDGYLARRAEEAGAERIEGTTVREVARDGVEFLCRTGEAEYRAPVVIGADGAESRVARFLPRSRREDAAILGVALEGELAPGPGIAGAEPETRFDFGAAPGGYGWVFPKRSHLSAGVFSRRSSLPSFRAIYAGYLAGRDLGPERAREERLSGHRIPVRPRRCRGWGGLLLAGDAAGLADPLTGEGISYAIRSGRMAAESALRAAGRPGDAAAIYEGLLADSLIPEIRAARFLSALIYAAPSLAYRLFRRRRHFAEAMVDVFLGRRTYGELISRALMRPWRLLR